MIRSLKSFLSHSDSRSVGLIFLASSLILGAWVTRLPEVKARLGLSEGELGFALFFMPLGAVVLLPFISNIIQKLGEKRATQIGLAFLLLTVPLPTIAPDYTTLLLSLFGMGLGISLCDVSMNAVAAAIENQTDRKIMATCHGFFSIGGMIGAATASLFFLFEINPFQHLVFWSLVLLLVAFLFAQDLILSDKTEGSSKVFQLPPKSVALLAVIGLCIMLSEGAITDWSTIYMRDNLLADETIAGLGFAGFSGLMALGRFMGDALILRHGNFKLMIAGCVLAICGLLLTLSGGIALSIAGFSLAGLGYAVLVPILFSESSRTPGVKPAVGIASVASMGYTGMLIGPVAIGFIAEEFGLSMGFLFLAILTTIALLLSIRIRS